MKSPGWSAVVCTSLLAGALACGSSPTGPPESIVAPVIESDGIAFDGQAIPAELIERLAPNRVVVVGETHHLTEHREFMAALVRELHGRGFRQLLMELPQMVDWLLVEYVNDGEAVPPGWQLPVELGHQLLAAVRDFNRTVPAGEQLLVRGIDANLDEYGGTDSFLDLFAWYAARLSEPGPITAFLSSPYDTPTEQAAPIWRLQDDLEAQRDELLAAWGQSELETVDAMVDAERASIPIRADRQDRYETSVRAREELIKRLCDERVAARAGGTLINIGGNHAQKSHMKGTELEWLGDYLVHRSPATDGSVYVLVVSAARIVSPDGATTLFDLSASPPNELFRMMQEAFPGRTVFLPLDDPLFTDEGVLVNFEEEIYSSRLKRVYDGALQYPSAHRDPGV
jgi:hypothetical protein